MELSSALLLPGVLTLLVLVLSWLYIKNQSRLAGEWSVNSDREKSSAERYSNPVRSEDEPPDQKEQVADDDSSLQAQVAPYLIDPGEIQNISEQVPPGRSLSEIKMKAKQEIGNIQSYYKTSRLHIKEMEGMLSQQEREQERVAQRKQLEEIFKLMEKEKEKFGLESMEQIEEQMTLYDVK